MRDAGPSESGDAAPLEQWRAEGDLSDADVRWFLDRGLPAQTDSILGLPVAYVDDGPDDSRPPASSLRLGDLSEYRVWLPVLLRIVTWRRRRR